MSDHPELPRVTGEVYASHQYPLDSCPRDGMHGLEECTVAVPCSKCGQVDEGQTGEYPCEACGVPTLHDAAIAPAPDKTERVSALN